MLYGMPGLSYSKLEKILAIKIMIISRKKTKKVLTKIIVKIIQKKLNIFHKLFYILIKLLRFNKIIKF